jgi:hypothetical protein
MQSEYTERLEAENEKLRDAYSVLETENCKYKPWYPMWLETVAGEELVIGSVTIGEVACTPSGEWAIFVAGNRQDNYHCKCRRDAKTTLIGIIMTPLTIDGIGKRTSCL